MCLAQLMEIDTKGICLLCFKEGSTGSQTAASSNGFKHLLDYVKVNTMELFNCNLPFLKSMDIQDSFDVRTTLCSNCSLVTEEFDKCYRGSMKKSQFDNCVQSVIASIMQGDNNPKRVQEYKNRMQPKEFQELVNASIASNLRGKLKNCSPKLNGFNSRSIPLIDLETKQGPASNPIAHVQLADNEGISRGHSHSMEQVNRMNALASFILSEATFTSPLSSLSLESSTLNQIDILVRHCEAEVNLQPFLKSNESTTEDVDVESSDNEQGSACSDDQSSQDQSTSSQLPPSSTNSEELDGASADSPNDLYTTDETDKQLIPNSPARSQAKRNSSSPSRKRKKHPFLSPVRKCRRKSKLVIGPITCLTCFQNFPCLSSLNDHTAKAHTASRKAKSRHIKKPNTPSKCPKCDYTADLPLQVACHMIDAHLHHVVMESLAKPVSEENLEQAINSVFDDIISNDLTCFICEVSFQRRPNDLKSHVANCHFDSFLNQVLNKITNCDGATSPCGSESYLLGYLGLIKRPPSTPQTPPKGPSKIIPAAVTPPISRRLPLRGIQPRKVGRPKRIRPPSPCKPFIIDIKCDLCSKSFNSVTRFNAHLFAAHPLEDAPIAKFPKRSRRSSTKAKICVNKPSVMKTNRQPQKFRCGWCPWSCGNAWGLKDHENYSHLVEVLAGTVLIPGPESKAKCTQVVDDIFGEMSLNGMKCFLCDKVVTGMSNLTRHAVRYHLTELTDKVRERINADEKKKIPEIEFVIEIEREDDDTMMDDENKKFEVITLD